MAFTKSIEELIAEDTSGLLSKHESWLRIRLGDVAKVLNGYAFSSNYFNSAGKGLPLIRIRDVVSGKTNTFYDGEYGDEYLISDGDLLVGMDGDFNSAFWRSGHALLNQRVCKISSESKHYSFLFLVYLLPHYLNAVHQQTSSITVKHLSSNTINNLLLPLPPENEQVRIVEKLEELLSELDNGVAELKAAQTKLTQYRQSLLKSAVEGTLTEEWRAANAHKITETGEQLLARILKERRIRWEKQKLEEFATKNQTPPKDWQKKYLEPVKPATSDLPELPEGWVWATIDQCVLEAKGITDGPFGSNLKSSHYVSDGPRVIRLQNIGDGVFYDEKAHITDKHYQTLLKHSIETDDVVVAMMGEILPRSCLIPAGVAPGIVKADCARVRVNKDLLSPYLLASYLNSLPTRQRTKSLIKGIGRPRINLGHIRVLAVPITSLSEQQAIVDSLNSQFDETSNKALEIEISLRQIDAQRKNILKEAFSGKLLPQDPRDEPASVLLEKIKAERLAQAKQPKSKQTRKKANNKASIMDTLLEILEASGGWMDAQEAFRACGVSDGTETNRIEELYAELRKLDKAGKLLCERHGDYDMIKLKEE